MFFFLGLVFGFFSRNWFFGMGIILKVIFVLGICFW